MIAYTRRELLGLLGTAALAKGGPPPNILYIMADDHAAHAISAYGSRINQTPNIDRIASGGVRLSNCFCTNSICTPSRAAILTGQYSHKNGVYYPRTSRSIPSAITSPRNCSARATRPR